MEIYGLQKTSLLDYPGKVAAVVFLGGCNFDCPYCHNRDIARKISGPVMPESELRRFLDSRKGFLDGVVISGGEPCLPGRDPSELIGMIRSFGYSVKLDTNGYNPEMLKSLLWTGYVDYVAMDIKNVPQKYAVTAGLKNFDATKIDHSIRIIMSSGVDYEFRTTVMKELHKPEDFELIGMQVAGAKRYFIQQLSATVRNGFTPMRTEDILESKRILEKYVETVGIRGVNL